MSLSDAYVVFEVDGETLNPLIKVCLGQLATVSSQNQTYLFGIDLQLDEILQEDAHQVRTDIPSFLLGCFTGYFMYLFAEVSYFRMMTFFVVCGSHGIQNDIYFELTLILVG